MPEPHPPSPLAAFAAVVEAAAGGAGWADRVAAAVVGAGLAESAAVVRGPAAAAGGERVADAGPRGGALAGAGEGPRTEASFGGGRVVLPGTGAEVEALGRAVAAVCAGCEAAESSSTRTTRARTLDQAASEERFRLLAEQTSDVITRNALDGRFTYVSPAVRVVLGFEPEELVGRWPREFTHPDDRASVISARPELLAEPDRTVVREFRMRHADGGYRRVEAASRWFKGTSRDIVVVFRDVTRRVEAERGTRALRDADAHAARKSSIAELAALLAHELNQPLAALTNYAALVARQATRPDADPDRLAAAAARVHEEALRAQGIVGRLRSFLQHRTPRRDPLELRPLLREAAAGVRAQADAAGVKLDVRPEREELRFAGDAMLLRQVLVNLLQNAVHAASEGLERRVTLSAGAAGDGIVFRVADTGPRLSEAQRSRFFEPFHSTRTGGLGLGLVLSRSIVRSHGGRLRVEVPAAGDGLAMVVELPRSPVAAPAGAAEPDAG